MTTSLTDTNVKRRHPTASTNDTDGWAASIDIALVRRARTTRLARASHRGPLYVQRALYPEGAAVCHLYLLHPPGGVVQGDRLDVTLRAPAETAALVTTPSAGKVYRAPDKWAHQIFDLTVGAEAAVEWLPQETIVYERAQLATYLRIDLAADARLIAWDMQVLGRPAAGEGFEHGALTSTIHVDIDGEPALRETGSFLGSQQSPVLDSAWGLAGYRVLGTFIAYCSGGVDEATRAELNTDSRVLVAASTQVDDLLILRALAAEADVLRSYFETVWQRLRPAVMGRAPMRPRIWST